MPKQQDSSNPPPETAEVVAEVFPKVRTFDEVVMDHFGKRTVTKTETTYVDGTVRVDH